MNLGFVFTCILRGFNLSILQNEFIRALRGSTYNKPPPPLKIFQPTPPTNETNPKNLTQQPNLIEYIFQKYFMCTCLGLVLGSQYLTTLLKSYILGLSLFLLDSYRLS